MEKPVTSLKAFILANWNAYLTAATTPQVPLAQLAAVNCVAGVLDPDTHLDSLSVFILPDVESYEAVSIETTGADCSMSVYIMARNADQELLFSQVMRYGETMRQMIMEHPTLDGSIAEIEPTLQDFYWGIDGNQDIKAVKIDFRVLYET